jgi:hypothetical protein
MITNLDLCLELMAFSSVEGLFYMPHLLRHRSLVYTVSSERPTSTSHGGIRIRDARIISFLRACSIHCVTRSLKMKMIIIMIKLMKMQYNEPCPLSGPLFVIGQNYKIFLKKHWKLRKQKYNYFNIIFALYHNDSFYDKCHWWCIKYFLFVLLVILWGITHIFSYENQWNYYL